jgi:hypothetical protein
MEEQHKKHPTLEEVREILQAYLKKTEFDDKIKIVVLEHEKETRKRFDGLYADKEVEIAFKWFIRITTGALIAGVFMFFIQKLIEMF